MLPLIIGGAIAAGGGLLGNALTGGFSKPKEVQAVLPDDQAYKWGGPNSATMRERGDQALTREALKLDWSQANRDYEASYDARRQQQENVQDFRDVLSGKAPSLAQEQLKAGLDRALQNNAAQAAGARGSAQAMAARAAAFAGAEAGQKTAQDAAMLRAQEVAQARTGLTSALGQMRGQDFTARAGSQQQQQIIGSNELDQRRLNDARSAMFWQSEMQKSQAELNAAMSKDAARMGGINAANQANAAAQAAYQQRMAQMWGSLTNAGGGLMSQGIAAGNAAAAQDKQHAHEKQMAGLLYGQPSSTPAPSVDSSSIDWGTQADQYGEVGPSSLPAESSGPPSPAPKMDQYGTDDPNSPYYNPWSKK